MLKRHCLKWKLTVLLGIRKKLKDALSGGADIWLFIFLQDCIFVVRQGFWFCSDLLRNSGSV